MATGGGRRVGAWRRAPRSRSSRCARKTYAGLNTTHLTEKLQAEGLAVSRVTVHRVLRAAGVARPRHRRPPRHRARRERKAQAGLLVLWDGSPHAWLETRGPRCCLVGAMDDATGHLLPGALFVPAEDAGSYLRVLRTVVGTCGIPVALYMDRHGIFQRHDAAWTLAEELRGAQEPTQVGRALAALGIAAIFALSPQAKGRIERLWGTLQDRLVAELRLAGITTLAAANAFLPGFTVRFNARFGRPAADPVAAWRPVPRGLDLERHLQLLHGGHGAQRQHRADAGPGPPDPAGARGPGLRQGSGRSPPAPRWVVADLPPRPAPCHAGGLGGSAGPQSAPPSLRWPLPAPG